MNLLNRHQFTNDKVFEVHHLTATDQQHYELPECDVIGLIRDTGGKRRLTAMRPDEALILARLLIDAVYQVTEGYATAGPKMTIGYESIGGVRALIPIAMEIVDNDSQ